MINVCIVGCSDGKFVFPFLRNGYKVTAIDIDSVALYGGVKLKPIERAHIIPVKYMPSETKQEYRQIPSREIIIHGLKHRAESELVDGNLTIIQSDFYRNPLETMFDVVFTSCSIQYKSNRDIPVSDIMETLKNHVKPNGLLYMDYMMPLEDNHIWKSPHFFRTGQIKSYFQHNWIIEHIKEMKAPIFEIAHVDRLEDHYHRLGYILAKKIK
jgi:2-polyprenyl-3-methyl-5-hydroxy-6-metoxy-1,4-benzoquinol methylase